MRSMGPACRLVYIAQTGRSHFIVQRRRPTACADWLRKLTQLFWHVKVFSVVFALYTMTAALLAKSLTKAPGAPR